MKQIAYHEAAHVVFAHLTRNLNFGVELYETGHIAGAAFQKSRLDKYRGMDSAVVQQILLLNEEEARQIRSDLSAHILILLAGRQAEQVYLNEPVANTPIYIDGSDDEKFDDAVNWYCNIVGRPVDAIRLSACFTRASEDVYNLMKDNAANWRLIKELAEKLYASPNKKLSTFWIFIFLGVLQMKMAVRGAYLPLTELNIIGIIEETCV